MSDNSGYVNNLKLGWFAVMSINFIFGACGIINCSLKLKYETESSKKNLFKLSLIIAISNVVLSILLLLSVIKDCQRCAFITALLCFFNLFGATVYVEISTTFNIVFLSVFCFVGFLSLTWFCIYGVVLCFDKKRSRETFPVIPL